MCIHVWYVKNWSATHIEIIKRRWLQKAFMSSTQLNQSQQKKNRKVRQANNFIVSRNDFSRIHLFHFCPLKKGTSLISIYKALGQFAAFFYSTELIFAISSRLIELFCQKHEQVLVTFSCPFAKWKLHFAFEDKSLIH